MNAPTPERILVFLPNWVGDVVMATPALAALRARFPQARIVAIGRPYVNDVLSGLDIVNEVRCLDSLKDGSSFMDMLADARTLRRAHFEMTVLMTNSLRTAIFAFLARAGYRVGYAREGRGPLLHVKLAPKKSNGRYEPGPMIDYYFALVASVGSETNDRRMRLAVTPEERAAADEVLKRFEIDASKPIAVINPGAAFGSSKCWSPISFAAVADRLAARGMEPVVITSPREAEIAEKISAAAASGLKPVWRTGFTLGLLKAFIARAAIVVTNDSAPRHYAAALGVPVVTLFGSTDERWSDTGYEKEVIINKHVECSPCQLKVCPRDHVCMTSITPDDVMGAVGELIRI